MPAQPAPAVEALPQIRAVLSRIIELAAECAQRKPLAAFDALRGTSHIGHRQFAAADSRADEAVRLLAIELRKVADSLSAAIASPAGDERTPPAPQEST